MKGMLALLFIATALALPAAGLSQNIDVDGLLPNGNDEVNIGSMAVTVGAGGEAATLQLSNAYKYLMDGDCQFRWFQEITATNLSNTQEYNGSSSPANGVFTYYNTTDKKWEAVGQGPFVDPVSGGYGYQNPGAASTGGGDDNLPFYENNAEYAGTHNDAAGTSSTSDTPGFTFAKSTGTTDMKSAYVNFETWCVFYNPQLASMHEFDVLEGFSWSAMVNAGAMQYSYGSELEPTAGELTLAQNALNATPSGFSNWTAVEMYPLNCTPEPSSAAMLLAGLSGLALLRRRARRPAGNA